MMLLQDKQFSSQKNTELRNHWRFARIASWTRVVAIGFPLIAISAFVLLYAPLRSVVTQAVYSVAPFVWETGDASENALETFLANFKEKDALVKENETLKEIISVMEVKVLDRNLLAEKVTRLEESLGRSHSDDRVVANLLVGTENSLYDTFIIDAGQKEGIYVGNMVVYSGSGIIGKIVETTPYSAKIKLYSSPGEEHRVRVGSRNIPIIAVGKGMGNFEAKVPQDSVVSIGDYVLTVNDNLILGVVSLIEEKPEEPIKRIYFRVPFNIMEIQTVEVIIGNHI